MTHKKDTVLATPSSRIKAASAEVPASSASGVQTDPGIGGAANATTSPAQPITCPAPASNRAPGVPQPPDTQPRLSDDTSSVPPPFAASAATLAPAAEPGSNDSMDVLLEAIGSQDKPFMPKRTAATAGERAAVYEGRHAAPPATTDPTPGPSVIVAHQESMPPAITRKIVRAEVDTALKARGVPVKKERRPDTTTVVVDPVAPSNKLLKWTVAGVIIAACFVAAAGLHNAFKLETGREARASGPAAPSAGPALVAPAALGHGQTPAHVEPNIPAPPDVPPPAEHVAEPAPKKAGKASARSAKVGSGLDQAEPAQPAAPAPAASPPKKPKPNVPGLEDLKTDY